MRYSILILLVLAGCEQQPQSPATQAEFLESFRRSYDPTQTAGPTSLVWWKGVPDDLRALMTNTLAAGGGMVRGTITITNASLIDYVAESPWEIGGRPIEPNLEPKYWVMADYEGKMQNIEKKFTGSKKFAVGVTNGCFYICGVRWKNAEPVTRANSR